MVDGCGYDVQQKYAIVTLVGRATRFEVVRPVFCQIRQICAYELLRCLDVEMWQFFVDNNDRTNYPLHMRAG